MLKPCLVVVGTACLLNALGAHCGWAGEKRVISVPEEQCKNLETADLAASEDAPVQVTDTKLVESIDGERAYCRVRGYISPQVGFELQLPAADWNGKFIEVGCGGFCGNIDEARCSDPLRRGYACITSDMGHRGRPNSGDGLWAYNDLQAKVDWGYRGPHVVALAGKAITQQYYNGAIKRAYFTGCSTGGREGLVEAQRFPWDFDGIVAGAPSINFTAISMAQLWAAMAVLDSHGSSVLNPTSVKLVHDAVLAQCDLDDGVRDGVVSQPRGCRFDPATLACKSKASAACLTDKQIAALKKIYAGPFAPKSSNFSGAFMPGSELAWQGVYFSADGGPGFLLWYDTQKFRYATFSPDPGPSWNPADLDFARDVKRFGVMESLYSATNPDLRQFERDGGKLIVYQGWNDPLEPPSAITDYYETAERVIGSRSATQAFFRLFMVPGMNHCVGGEGAWAVDYLTYLEDWVERGKAPSAMIGVHVALPDDSTKARTFLEKLRFPVPASEVSFSRPVYPYPGWARYNGKGDPNDASNFAPERN